MVTWYQVASLTSTVPEVSTFFLSARGKEKNAYAGSHFSSTQVSRDHPISTAVQEKKDSLCRRNVTASLCHTPAHKGSRVVFLQLHHPVEIHRRPVVGGVCLFVCLFVHLCVCVCVMCHHE